MTSTPGKSFSTIAKPNLSSRHDVLRIGFMPLTDSAPLIVAEMLGYFNKQGVKVELSQLNAWAAMRDKLSIGQLDGGQMLAPMPIAASLGVGGVARTLPVVSVLASQGNTITLGDFLLDEIRRVAPDLVDQRPLPATALAALIRERKRRNQSGLVLAVVYPFSSHTYLLRHWLAAGGIDTERDVHLRAVPPSMVAEELAEGRIDGFCAGQPWGSRAVDLRAGSIVLGTGDIWPRHPEKLLAVSADLLENAPEAVAGLVAATMQAGQFLSDPANHKQAAKWVHYYALPQVPLSVVMQSLAAALPYGPDEAERPFAASLFSPALSCPQAEHGAWWLRQMQRWGHVPPTVDQAPLAALWHSDIWREAARRIGFDTALAQAPTVPFDAA